MMRKSTASLAMLMAYTIGLGCSSNTAAPEGAAQSSRVAITRAELDGDYVWPTTGVVVAPGSSGFSWRYRFGDETTGWEQTNFDATSWSTGRGGFYYGTALSGDSTSTPWPSDQSELWARSTFTVTSEAAKDLMLWGRWDDKLSVYINGVRAIGMKDWVSSYRYVGISPEARATIRAGVPNTIAVHVHDNGGGKYMDLGLVSVPQLMNTPVSGYAINPALDVVTDFVKEQMSLYGISAGVVAVGRGRSLVLSRGIGYMDKQFSRTVPHDAIMRLASLDKPPTKAVIDKMISEGVVNPHTNQPLTYDTKVLALLDSYGIQPVGPLPDQRWQDVTIQHLIKHTSGVAGSIEENRYYEITGVPTEAATIDSNARYLISQPLQWTPGSPPDPDPYSSTGYMLLRYVAHLLSGNFESYVQNQLLAPTGNRDMYIVHERVEDRITAADGSLREPWYTTFEQPHDRWIAFDYFTALASSADAYTLFHLFYPGWFFYGGMAGTQSVSQEYYIGGETVVLTAIFNHCCAIPMDDWKTGFTGMDGKIGELLRGLPESAWHTPVAGVDCKLGSVSTWNDGYVFGDVQITNTSQQTMTSWGIELDFAQPSNVMPMYGYNYMQSGNNVNIQTAFPWNGTLAPGQTWHMAIQGQHSGTFVPPTCKSL